MMTHPSSKPQSRALIFPKMKSPYFNPFKQIEGDLNPTTVTIATPEVPIDYPTTVEGRDNFRTSKGKVRNY